MASATSSFHASLSLRRLPPSQIGRSLLLDFRSHFTPSPTFSPRISIALARRRNNSGPVTTSFSKKKKKKKENDEDEENLFGDALEALFDQLEEDLKNDDSLVDDDEEISEEELMMLERELDEALKDDDLLEGLDSSQLGEAGGIDDDVEEEEDDDDDDDDKEEEELVKLKNWQLRRLAYALKSGRRKTSIKNLAADLCLERAVVLKLLRDPPPDLLLLSATLPDKPDSNVMEPSKSAMTVAELESETLESSASEGAIMELTSKEKKEKVPIHVKQRDWYSRKRLKKVHVGTLERVYKRSKRPTNAMIMSIVHVTNLPRKKVVTWFEEKRAEDGIPDEHLPYIRSSSETGLS